MKLAHGPFGTLALETLRRWCSPIGDGTALRLGDGRLGRACAHEGWLFVAWIDPWPPEPVTSWWSLLERNAALPAGVKLVPGRPGGPPHHRAEVLLGPDLPRRLEAVLRGLPADERHHSRQRLYLPATRAARAEEAVARYLVTAAAAMPPVRVVALEGPRRAAALEIGFADEPGPEELDRATSALALAGKTCSRPVRALGTARIAETYLASMAAPMRDLTRKE
ncbi:MAG: hypothetical protein ACRENB_05395 [Gemmatimonadales bacterium]